MKGRRVPSIPADHAQTCGLAAQYERIVDKIRACAPPGLTEVRGAVHCHAGPDFRLDLEGYRVIGVFPRATQVQVFMEWRKLFRNRMLYEEDVDFIQFEDAFGYLGVNENWDQPWNIHPDTDLEDPMVDVFLETGMRMIVRELGRIHPELRR